MLRRLQVQQALAEKQSQQDAGHLRAAEKCARVGTAHWAPLAGEAREGSWVDLQAGW